MTLKSMTGFGQGFAEGSGLRLEVEISSVNRKQLDIVSSLPRSLQALEPWMQERISHHLSRGRITVQVSMQAAGRSRQAAVTIDQAMASRCLRELRQAAAKLGIDHGITINDLVRIPGVLLVHDAGEELDQVKPVLQKALDRALKSFMAMRGREGAALRRDVSVRIGRLDRLTRDIARRAPGLVARYRRNLRARIDQLAGDLLVSDERLEKEVVLFADRADITEELTRLSSHLSQARGMLGQDEPAGRSLDFLAQEMFREINTIGSKASDAAISSKVVRFKAELERLREQVQNVE